MHHLISDINGTVFLKQYIDNRKSDKRIGLKSITYYLDWYNISNENIKTIEREYTIPAGYYSFDLLAEKFSKIDVILEVDSSNGIVQLISDKEFEISNKLKTMLGYSKEKTFKTNTGRTKIFISDKPLDLMPIKLMYIHLMELNTSQNYFNGSPSTILSTVPIENRKFGDVITTRFVHPEYKCLMNGAISELKLEARDENNKKINNNGFPISCVLEIV